MAMIFKPKTVLALINRTKKTLLNHLGKAIESASKHGWHVDSEEMLQAYRFYKNVKSPDNFLEMEALVAQLVPDYFKFVRRCHLDNKAYKADMASLNEAAVHLTSLCTVGSHQALPTQAQKPLKKTLKPKQAQGMPQITPQFEENVSNEQANHYVKRWLKGFYDTPDCNFEQARAVYSESALVEKMHKEDKPALFIHAAIQSYHFKMSLWFNETNPLEKKDKVESQHKSTKPKNNDYQNGKRAGYSFVWNYISSYGELRPWLTKKELFDKYQHRSDDFIKGYYESYKNKKQRLIDEQQADPAGFADKLKSSMKKR